jgi:uncharacterized protein YjbJ (UPF0337 family)
MAGKVDKAKGRAKRAAGEVTGNQSLKNRGSVDKGAGRVKDATSKAAGKAAEKTKKGIRRSK